MKVLKNERAVKNARGKFVLILDKDTVARS